MHVTSIHSWLAGQWFRELKDNTDSSTLQSDLDKLVFVGTQTEFNIQKCKVMHVVPSLSLAGFPTGEATQGLLFK